MSEAYMGEIRLFPWDFAPKKWALCNGAQLSVAQNSALFSLLGVTYGGNGTTNFNLPDLRGRVIVGSGQLAGGSNYAQGEAGGVERVTLITSQMPIHNHLVNVSTATGTAALPANITSGAPSQPPGYVATSSSKPAGSGGTPVNLYASPNSLQPLAATSVDNSGGNQSHPNMEPFQVANYCICIQGIFPSRN